MAEKKRQTPVDHTHRGRVKMTNAALLEHLESSHGWTPDMVRQRGTIEGGSYARAWHQNAHKTAHLDNPRGT